MTFGTSGPGVRAGAAGSAVDVAAAVQAVSTSWLGAMGPVALPVPVAEPPVTQAEAERALAQIARPAASGPLTVVVGRAQRRAAGRRPGRGPPAGPAADPTARRCTTRAARPLALDVDGAVLRRAVLAVAPGVESAPHDARIVLRKGRPQVVPEVDGVALDPAALAAAANSRAAHARPYGDSRRRRPAPPC